MVDRSRRRRRIGGNFVTKRLETLETTQMPKGDALEMDGSVVDALRNSQFKVRLDNGHEVLAYTGGKMRRFRIRILLGDRVRVEMSPYDLTRGRVSYRYR
jgi:translation initiation factor IF-1